LVANDYAKATARRPRNRAMNQRLAIHPLDVTLISILILTTAVGVLAQGFAGTTGPSPRVIAESGSSSGPAVPPTTRTSTPTAVAVTTTPTTTPVASPTPSATQSPAPTRRPTDRPRSTRTPTPAGPRRATSLTIDPNDHYWLSRPIPADARNYISRFYPYGSTARGRYQTHHGVEFENPTGTPVQATAPGRVIVAGPDNEQVYGLFPDFYGRLVVIKHTPTFHGKALFTLYGHLDRVTVEPGQQVKAGDVIGEVGEAGIALGPHLHMEVRVGDNTYAATRNPELWIEPFDGHGTIAGRLTVAPEGEFVPGALVSLYDAQGQWRTDAETYSDGANPDEEWGENFVIGDLPAGIYTVQYSSGVAETVTVLSGKTSLVTLKVDAPAK
jgi:murein DD-endopeptidase MepM/ murein hydrolase activator NlpD